MAITKFRVQYSNENVVAAIADSGNLTADSIKTILETYPVAYIYYPETNSGCIFGTGLTRGSSLPANGGYYAYLRLTGKDEDEDIEQYNELEEDQYYNLKHRNFTVVSSLDEVFTGPFTEKGNMVYISEDGEISYCIIPDEVEVEPDAISASLFADFMIDYLSDPEDYYNELTLSVQLYGFYNVQTSITYESFNTIKIDGKRIFRPNDFSPNREMVYAGSYTASNGKLYADRIGWRYASLTMNWDTLPEKQLNILLNMQKVCKTKGYCTIEFEDSDGNLVKEKIVPVSFNNTATRWTNYRDNNSKVWRAISLNVRFIDVHNS